MSSARLVIVGGSGARRRPPKPGKVCLTVATAGSGTRSQQPASRPIGVSSTSVTRRSITRPGELARSPGQVDRGLASDYDARRSCWTIQHRGDIMAAAERRDFNPPYLHPAHEATVLRAPSKRLIEVPRVRPTGNDLTK